MERAEAAEGAALVTVEEGCQEAQKKKAEKKGRWTRTVERKELGMKSLMQWLRASRRRQACMMTPRRLHKEQQGKVSSQIVTARKSKTKKRRKTRWKVQWAEDEMLEERLERRRMEGISFRAEVMQKVQR